MQQRIACPYQRIVSTNVGKGVHPTLATEVCLTVKDLGLLSHPVSISFRTGVGRALISRTDEHRRVLSSVSSARDSSPNISIPLSTISTRGTVGTFVKHRFMEMSVSTHRLSRERDPVFSAP